MATLHILTPATHGNPAIRSRMLRSVLSDLDGDVAILSVYLSVITQAPAANLAADDLGSAVGALCERIQQNVERALHLA